MLAAALPAFSVEVGLPTNELAAARNAGVFFDGNLLRLTLGPLYRPAHPTLLPVPGPMGAPVAIPWTFPLVLLVRLHEPTADERALFAQAAPDPVALARAITALNQPERAPGRAPVVLGVDPELIRGHGAVSAECAPGYAPRRRGRAGR